MEWTGNAEPGEARYQSVQSGRGQRRRTDSEEQAGRVLLLPNAAQLEYRLGYRLVLDAGVPADVRIGPELSETDAVARGTGSSHQPPRVPDVRACRPSMH